MSFGFVEAEKAQFPVSMLCEAIGVSRPGYYAWARRGPSARSQRDEELAAKVVDIHARSRRIYGSPRVHDELREQGERVGRKRVARLMRERGLAGKRRRRFRVTTKSAHGKPVAPNVLARDFKTSAPNRAWVGDITYIWTREGWLYLAVLLDLYSRKVVGWAMSEWLTTELALRALRMAVTDRKPRAGLVHHTDRGVQYASAEYQRLLSDHGITASMSRTGDCWDNAVAESFFATLKVELELDFDTRQQARTAVFEYIEAFYNRQRRHSTISYATPWSFELDFEKAKNAA